MPRGDKSRYSGKQKHQAERIEESYEARGVDHKEAEARAWATVNKQSGGGEKSGGGRKALSAHQHSPAVARYSEQVRGLLEQVEVEYFDPICD